MFLSENLKKLRIQKKMTQKELALATGFTHQYIARLEKGLHKNVPYETIKMLAEALDTTPNYLYEGQFYHNPQSFGRLQKKAPVLGWNQVEKWLIHGGRMENEVALEYIDIVSTSPEACFVLEITNDTMECFGKESFNKGEYIIVEPTNDAESGEFVICTLSPDSEPILRKITKEGGRITLMPLNKRYRSEEIIDTKNFKILGVVIETRRLIHRIKKP